MFRCCRGSGSKYVFIVVIIEWLDNVSSCGGGLNVEMVLFSMLYDCKHGLIVSGLIEKKNS